MSFEFFFLNDVFFWSEGQNLNTITNVLTIRQSFYSLFRPQLIVFQIIYFLMAFNSVFILNNSLSFDPFIDSYY
jgi:hypothetical protein